MTMQQSLAMTSLVPTVVAGVEQLHAEADSATKQEMAQDALLLASGVYSGIDPEHAAITQAAAGAACVMINAIVSLFNTTGMFKHKKAAASVPVPVKPVADPAPSPVPVAAVLPVAIAPVVCEAVSGPGLHTLYAE